MVRFADVLYGGKKSRLAEGELLSVRLLIPVRDRLESTLYSLSPTSPNLVTANPKLGKLTLSLRRASSPTSPSSHQTHHHHQQNPHAHLHSNAQAAPPAHHSTLPGNVGNHLSDKEKRAADKKAAGGAVKKDGEDEEEGKGDGYPRPA